MIKIFLTFLTAMFAIGLSLARADNTYRESLGTFEHTLQSKEGLNIFIISEDFASGITGATQRTTAEHIHVSVHGSIVNFSTHAIQALLIPNCRLQSSGTPVVQPTLFADLTAQTDGSSIDFSGEFQSALLVRSAIHGGDNDTVCDTEFAIVVDGVWQTDPINGTHNFKVEM